MILFSWSKQILLRYKRLIMFSQVTDFTAATTEYFDLKPITARMYSLDSKGLFRSIVDTPSFA